jgi:hypothetical protein
MVILMKIYKRRLNVQLYAPFLPFIIGLYSALPYFFLSEEKINTWINLFLLYEIIHTNNVVITLFGRLSFVAIICGAMYLYILLRYIELVKHCRRYGWNGGYKNA